MKALDLKPYAVIFYLHSALAFALSLNVLPAWAQSCPSTITTTTLSTYPNTYFRGTQATVSAGSTSLTVGAAGYGTTPISTGDILLIIQMQGAQFTATNAGSYGTGSGTSGSGYLANANLYAGNMEYAVASNSVALAGGTLNLVSGLAKSYKNAAYGTDGVYTYQVIRVPIYYRLQLTGTLTVPSWNGTSGGVLVLYAVDSILFNGQTINGSGMGFRGGGGVQLGGGSGLNTDYYSLSSNNTGGAKGEGIAGTPKFVFYGGTTASSGSEGYPSGTFDRGAPGNAGGGGTDGNPASNNYNTGGGGGGNGSAGGMGGNGWSGNNPTGGRGGAIFAQASPSRMVLGGGGGAGTTNDGTGTPGSGAASSGSAGGGMVIAIARVFSGTGTIDVSGASGNTTVANDGSGGGGAGGSVLLYASSGIGLSNLSVTANGGAGGSNSGGGSSHGPGGGGGGGVIYSNAALGSSSTSPGAAGTTAGGINYGSTASGSSGVITPTISAAQLPSFPLNCTILASGFISLTANQLNEWVDVNWEVPDQTNILEYEIERSSDGSHFSTIGSTPYKTTRALINSYSYMDNNSILANPVLFYRVKQIDQAGQFIYSKTVKLTTSGVTADNTIVFPNPANESATIRLVSTSRGAIQLTLSDLKGSRIRQQEFQGTIGTNILKINNLATIPPGIYLLQCQSGSKSECLKLIINH